MIFKRKDELNLGINNRYLNLIHKAIYSSKIDWEKNIYFGTKAFAGSIENSK